MNLTCRPLVLRLSAMLGVLLGIAAAATFVVCLVLAANADYERRTACKARGGAVVAGLGYMGREWRCMKTLNV